MMQSSDIRIKYNIFIKKRAHPNHSHEVLFAVQQNNLDIIESILLDVSDPLSLDYGKHKNRSEIAALTRNDESVFVITDFLHSQGITQVDKSPYCEYIFAVAPVHQWERIFNTRFHELEQTEMELTYVRAPEITLPSILKDHVIAVFNTVQLPQPLPFRRNMVIRTALKHDDINHTTRSHGQRVKSEGSTVYEEVAIAHQNISSFTSPVQPPLGIVFPKLLNGVYGIKSNTAMSSSTQAVLQMHDQFASTDDLIAFQKWFRLPPDLVTPGENVISKCPEPSKCVESNLDVSVHASRQQKSCFLCKC